eukprot:3035150-Alexandrium_andersonii.AAC.1
MSGGLLWHGWWDRHSLCAAVVQIALRLGGGSGLGVTGRGALTLHVSCCCPLAGAAVALRNLQAEPTTWQALQGWHLVAFGHKGAGNSRNGWDQHRSVHHERVSPVS